MILWMLAGAAYWEVEVGLCYQCLCQSGTLPYIEELLTMIDRMMTEWLEQSTILLHLGVCFSKVVEQFTFELVGYLLKISAWGLTVKPHIRCRVSESAF